MRRLHQVRPMGGEEKTNPDRWGFFDMANIVPEGKSGNAEVRHRIITESEAKASRLRAAAGNEPAVHAGKIAMLFVGSKLMMSDTQHERDTNKDFLDYASGDVLIAGLGLGLILFPLLDQKHIKSVTVIEQSQGVIDLVDKPVREALGEAKAKKLTVVRADIFTWKAPRGARYDTIYFDIWPDIHRDNLREMRKLHERYRRRKAKPYSWVSSWLFQELKDGWY